MSRSATQGPLTTRSKNIFVTPIRKPVKQPDGTTTLMTTTIMSARSLNDKSIRVNRAWDGEVWDSYEADGVETLANGKTRQKFRIKKDGSHYQNQRCTNSGALFLLTAMLENQTFVHQPGVAGVGREVIAKMCFDVWQSILCFITGTQYHGELENVGYYALALRRPVSIFQSITLDPEFDPRPYMITDAAISGEEEIVLNMLDADPSLLLKTAIIKNSVGVEHEVTPLQAAIMANDVQLIERMKPYFERLTTDSAGNPIDGLSEMKIQMIAIYKESLQCYFDLTKEKIEKLNIEVETTTAEIAALTETISTFNTNKNQGKAIDWAALKLARETLETKQALLTAAAAALSDTQKHSAQYLTTLRSHITDPHYLEKLVQTHEQAQINNKFDFTPYVKAICDIDPNDPELQDVLALIDAKTDAETQAAVAKGVSPIEIGFTDKDGKVYSRAEVQALPFNQLTLIQKLNRFREKLTEHMQQEIIFNPNHILEGLKKNDYVWDEVDARRVHDPNDYAKRKVVFSQLAGRAQSMAAKPVDQDLKQGTWYLTENHEPRTREARFNTWNSRTDSIDRDSLIDVFISSPGLIDGVGYKFAVGVWGGGRTWVCGGRGAMGGALAFSKLMSDKNSKHSELITQLGRACTRKSDSRCSIM